jgi:EAL domain-containing protein (putative c-di-GMP-specific phosphodiesterase class I)
MPHSPPFAPLYAVAPRAPRSVSPRAPHDAAERRRVVRRLRHALTAGELLLHYQPLVTLNSGRIRGAEALVRLRHHRLGLLSANHFMPGAEQADIIVEFGGWLLEQACAQAVTWPEPASVAITLALRQLQDRQFIRQFLERLGRTGVAPERLELGLTEAMLTDSTTNTIFSLKALRGLGVRLTLTNFSATSASLPALRRLRPATVKLDGALIQNLDSSPAGNAMVRAAIQAGHELGCTVLADGVDTKRQFSKLLKLGCDEGQGYYFSPPLGAAQMTAQFSPG